MLKDIFKGLGNGFNEWSMIMASISEENMRATVEGFRITNVTKVLDINLSKISVCAPRLFISKKLLYFVRYILIGGCYLCNSKSDLSA